MAWRSAESKVLGAVGLLATLVWVFVVWSVLEHGNGVAGLFKGRLGPVGDFIGGFTAPLVFFWLLIGYRMQFVQLRLQREQLEEQRHEIHRDRTLRIMETTWPQLHELAHVIHHRWMAGPRFTIDPHESSYGNLKQQYDEGDKAIFCRELNDRLSGMYAPDYHMLLRGQAHDEPILLEWLQQFVGLYSFVASEAALAHLEALVSMTPHIGRTAGYLEAAWHAVAPPPPSAPS